MRDSTLLFLIKKQDNQITDICLAMKKRGFGVGRWNGTGGKVEAGESIEEAVMRETHEEIGVTPKNFYKIAELTFVFPHREEWNQLTHTYFCEEWDGDIMETEEMKPEWFLVKNIPFKEMWPDDPLWLPRVLKGELVKASFTFGEGDSVSEYKVVPIKDFN